MTTIQLMWAASLVIALVTLPVGAFRMLIYRSGEIDHTPTLHKAAWVAVALGSTALLVFVALTIYLLATGQRPI